MNFPHCQCLHGHSTCFLPVDEKFFHGSSLSRLHRLQTLAYPNSHRLSIGNRLNFRESPQHLQIWCVMVYIYLTHNCFKYECLRARFLAVLENIACKCAAVLRKDSMALTIGVRKWKGFYRLTN